MNSPRTPMPPQPSVDRRAKEAEAQALLNEAKSRSSDDLTSWYGAIMSGLGATTLWCVFVYWCVYGGRSPRDLHVGEWIVFATACVIFAVAAWALWSGFQIFHGWHLRKMTTSSGAAAKINPLRWTLDHQVACFVACALGAAVGLLCGLGLFLGQYRGVVAEQHIWYWAQNLASYWMAIGAIIGGLSFYLWRLIKE